MIYQRRTGKHLEGYTKAAENKKSSGRFGNMNQTINIADSNKYRMNQIFPFVFSGRQLRNCSHIGYNYATGLMCLPIDKADFHATGLI